MKLLERQSRTVSQMEMECETGPSKRRPLLVIDTEAVADTASHSHSSLPGGKYQVFLNFRGPDTRYGFTDFLYKSLTEKGVSTFRDNEELDKGKEIGPELRKAIMEESTISIPIFSKDYASGPWCLKELVLMLQCNEKRGQLILPIFYDVTPEEVKHQPPGSTYDKAFKEYKKSGNFSDETIEQWKKALKEVGRFVGWEVQKCANGYQAQLILEEIIPEVLLVLKTKFMKLPKNLVGMDDHKNEMMRLFNIAGDNVQIVGIYGMGGIGKTTVAKFIYNQLLPEKFDGCSFLENIQKMAKEDRGLVSLQKQLLSDTLNPRLDIYSVNVGTAIIEQIFCNKKVLIVLDDVNSISEFHSLVGDQRDCLGKGSKIIVTTKNKRVLDALKVEWNYELPIMNVVQSLQLFSKHAFDMEFPPKEYVSVSRKIASVAGGLPLALKSLGSYLFENKDPEIWEVVSIMFTETLSMFTETLSYDVWEKLRVDYEALNKQQRQIFLDVACLFCGMDKTIVFYMWEDCDCYPKIAFNELYLRSLVKVGDANELWMHNQHIALGNKIANEEIFLANRTRVWNHKEALELLDVLEELDYPIVASNVEALSLRFKLESKEKRCFRSKAFTGLVNLRYLRVDGADLDGDFNGVLFFLRWLNWRGCPRDFKPTNFRLKNLVILDLSNSGITEEWGGWNQIQMSNKLKVLQVADCAFRKTPNFSSCAHLEILILGHCQSLLHIDPSMGNLTNLKVLDFSYTDIRTLPPAIWMLEKLEVMDFTGCSNLDMGIPSNMERLSALRFLSFYGSEIGSLPASISGLTQLHTLNIGGCTELQLPPELPSSLRILNVGDITNLTSLVKLQELRLIGCHNLVEMPRDIGKLTKLEKLTLDDTKIKSLPEDIALLSQLKVLDIRSCEDLRYIWGLPSSLVELSVADCDSLKFIYPYNSDLKILSSVLLKNCNKLEWFVGLGKLESLTSLYVYVCEMLATSKNMPDLSKLKKLEILCISNCSELDKIQGLEGLELLKYLNLRDCEKLCNIEGLESLKCLEVLDVLRCTSLEPIPELPYTYIRYPEDEINPTDSVYSYWTELMEKKLDGTRQPVLSGYRNEAAQEAS